MAAPQSAVDRYEAERVIVDTIYVLDDVGGDETIPREPSFHTGAGRALTALECCAYVDRPDLAREFASRARRRRVLMGVGIGMARSENAWLRQRLGLPEDLRVEPLAGRYGGGARISGAF